MPVTKHKSTKNVRRSVSLPSEIDKKVHAIATHRRLSDNRVLVELIEQGIQAEKRREQAFFELAERFRGERDPARARQLGDQLGRFIFGE